MNPNRRTRSWLRAALLTAIAVLYVLSIPWYRSSDRAVSIWFGLPDWVAVALLCYAAAAVLNAWAWLLADVSDGTDGGPRAER